MNNQFEIIGDINEQIVTEIDINLSPLQLIEKLNIKFRENRRVIGVQIGGVLGQIAFGFDMEQPIKNRLDKYSSNYLMYFTTLFCPVDYLRFLSRFLIREINIDTEQTRCLNEYIESIAQGKAENDVIDKIKNVLLKLGNTYAENRIKQLYLQIINKFEYDILDHVENKNCKTAICRTLITAQCINVCPAKVYIPGYVSLMKHGEINKAYSLMRQTNPLSLICGKICARPCEDRCRRKEIENTVGVRALQKYVSLKALKSSKWTEDKKPHNGKTIGVIGAGPAGLTAAYYLQRSGYQVDIYEQLDFAGGMLSSCVPSYRMPSEDLNLEIDSIKNLGVNINYNCQVGKDISLSELKDKYDSVIIATGAKHGKKIESLIQEKTESAIEFLSSVRVLGRKHIGEKVVVLGGGDVAMDSARTALRLGAKSVVVVSLESYDTMPANKEDKENCLKEGVEFLNSYTIKSCTEDMTLTLIKCVSVVDLEGIFSPVYDYSIEKNIKTDNLILAIGQYPDLNFIGSSIKSNGGFICADKKTGETSEDKIYAVGDVVKTDIAIKAIADAKKVAEQIDKNLGGKGLYVGESIEIPEEILNLKTWDDEICLEPSRKIKHIEGDFSEVVLDFNEKDALYEANRCMRCDRNSIQPLWLRPKETMQ